MIGDGDGDGMGPTREAARTCDVPDASRRRLHAAWFGCSCVVRFRQFWASGIRFLLAVGTTPRVFA
jgi:hypothetical protein